MSKIQAPKLYIINTSSEPNNVRDYPFPRLRLPLKLLSTFLTFLVRNNVKPRCTYDSAKLLTLDFQRPVRCDEGLSEYAAWYRSVYCNPGREDS